MSSGLRRIAQLAGLAALILIGILHSAWATRLDSYTIDEPWHIVAGASYLQEGSLRLNPEHPPLVKLWVAPWVLADSFRFDGAGRITDKLEEREFADKVMFLQNDADRVQRSARLGMYWFHGLLFFVFAIVLWAEAGYLISVLALVFLLFDPTVAAHLPVVMTDLPLAILGGISMVLVARLIRLWTWRAAIQLGIALGLALAAKHSALILLSILPLIALAGCLISPVDLPGDRRKRVLQVLLAGLLPLAVLWAAYGFRYWEHTPGEDWFNRPLESKIEDVHSTMWKRGLRLANDTRVLPRPYLWGLADVVRAGIDGRLESALVFGRIYVGRAPVHYMPSAIAMKLPPAALALALLALVAVWRAWRSRRWFSVESVAWIAGTWMLLVLIRSGTVYGGVRHALFLWMMIAVAAATAGALFLRSERRVLRAAVCALWAVHVAAAWPIQRPWSYHNFLAGGTENAHLSIANEGLDLGQRNREVAQYYHRELKPRGIKPFLVFFSSKHEWQYRGVEQQRFSELPAGPGHGVYIVGPAELSPGPERIYAPFLSLKPIRRIGVLQVFEGSIALPRARARHLGFQAAEKLYGARPDPAEALKLLEEAAALAPDMAAIQIELGNVRLGRGEKTLALAAYTAARTGPAVGVTLGAKLDAHIAAVAAAPDLRTVTPFRNPAME